MHEHTATVNGHELRFATEGDGEPLLLVPGHTMSIDRWVDAAAALELVGAFRDRRRAGGFRPR